LRVRLRPPLGQMKKPVDVEQARPGLFILKSRARTRPCRVSGERARRLTGRGTVRARCRPRPANRGTCSCRRSSAVPCRTRPKATRSDDGCGRATSIAYVIQRLDLVFVVLQNVTVGAATNESRRVASSRDAQWRASHLIRGSHSSLYMRSIACSISSEYTRLCL
jgi:hypothetical protein